MKRILTILLAGLMIGAFAAPASAIEIDLTGTWLWGYDYIAQAGPAGFFGPHDFENPALHLIGGEPRWNVMNGFLGFRTINNMQYGMVTGADGSLQWSRMELNPEIRINKAIRLRGAYQIGSGTNEYGLYANSASFGAWNPIASGTWTQLWLSAQMPMGIFVAGKRASPWGIGVQWDARTYTTEGMGFIAPYGPLRVGITIYLQRGTGWSNSDCNVNPFIQFAGFHDSWDRLILRTSINSGPQVPMERTASIINYRTWDKDRVRIDSNPTFTLQYQAGNVDTGIRYAHNMQHNGPGGALRTGSGIFVGGGDADALTFDATYEDGGIYFKYNNGRFFFNSEVAWTRNEQRVQNALTPVAIPTDGGGHPLAPNSNEAWKYGFELGAMSGPAKLSLLYSWVPGPDRRHGIWIHNQSWETNSLGQSFGNSMFFLPYSLLMGYQYGAGLNAINRNGEGFMTDAISYGARLDYAVAANLNLYGTFFYSNRQSKGWPWGTLTLASDPTNGGGAVIVVGQQIFGLAGNAFNGSFIEAPQNLFTNGAPNIPDDSLGWEATFGADWKLLEGLTMSLRCAYWEVGNWFKYACVDKSRSTAGGVLGLSPFIGGQGLPENFTGFAVNPNRAIDPVWMFQGVMAVDF